MKITVNKAVLITWISAILGGTLLFTSCKKNEVRTPSVDVLQPPANSFFDFGDTIFVSFRVSHPNIQGISLTLVDASHAAVEPVEQISIKASSAEYQSYIVITNKYLQSGKHNIRVQVKADGEDFNTFRGVNIGQLQREKIAVYVATSNGVNRNLYRIENGQETLSHSILGDCSGLATNSFSSAVYLPPNYFEGLRVYKPLNDSLLWQDPNNAIGGAPFMNGVFSSDDAVYGLYHDGRIIKYGNHGGYARVLQLPIGFSPIDGLFLDSHVIIAAINQPSQKTFLFYFSATTGAQLRKIELFDNVNHIALTPYHSTAISVFYNDAQSLAKWRVYNLQGVEINVQSLPAFQLMSAQQIDQGSFALGTDDGTKLLLENQSSLPTISQIQPNIIRFDEVTSELYLASGGSVWVYSFPSITLKDSYTLVYDVKGISFYYNK